MASAYGLALQGVGLVPIDVNIMPVAMLRDQIWHAKTKWFAAAAAIVIAGAGMSLYRPLTDMTKINGSAPPAAVTDALRQGEAYKDRYETLQSETNIGATVTNMVSLLDYRDIWPHVVNDAAMALASADPQENLRDGDGEAIRATAPGDRRIILLRELAGKYVAPADDVKTRRVRVTMWVEVSHDDWDVFLNDSVATWLREHAEPADDRADVPYRIIRESVSWNHELVEKGRLDAQGQEQVVKSTGSSRPRESRGPTKRGGDSGLYAGGGGGALRDVGEGNAQAPGGGGSGGGLYAGGSGGALQGGGSTRKSGSNSSGGGRKGRRPGTGTIRIPTGGEAPLIQHGPLDIRAPMPVSLPLYPPESHFYLVPVKFTIEILDQKTKPMGDGDVASRPRDGEVAS
jgi:hypothetical protein